ncbi:MAG: hypothetical protein NZO58_03355 [Gemmataceae bacterium]|nr:hypothetical protein [Gemmataceae bacterium]
MLIRIFLTTVSLVSLICVSAGAWTRQPTASSQPTPLAAHSLPSSVSTGTLPAQTTGLDGSRDRRPPATLGGPLESSWPEDDGSRLLDSLLLEMAKVRWLRLTVAQQSHGGGFRSWSKVTLGPNDCARAETVIHADGTTTHLLAVCDGRSLAEVTRRDGGPEKVATFRLPQAGPNGARGQFLRKFGCVGPAAIVAELRAVVPRWQVDTVRLDGKETLRLEGRVDTTHPRVAGRWGGAAMTCRLFVDAQSHWPVRLEWWRGQPAAMGRLELVIEYRDVVVDQPLTHEQCVRAFSYDPDFADNNP